MTTLKSFLDWHKELRHNIEQQHFINRDAEVKYLDNLLEEKLTAYFQQLHELAQHSLHFDAHQKASVFHSPLAKELHQLLKGSPFYYHSIFKPRGYVGDAETMAMFYRNQYEGVDPFSRFMHRIGMMSLIGQAIRNRKNWMIQAFKKHQPKRILSLAAGPAQEIITFQQENNNQQFLALDHDIQTLREVKIHTPTVKYGIINAFHLIRGKHNYLIPKPQKLNYCNPKKDNKGWRKVGLPFKYEIKKLEAQHFDLVYSIGLFDYIRTYDSTNKGTKALTSRLFNLLNPGGRLIIGNISPKMPIGIRWIMECICDWHLIYRNETQLHEFTAAIPPAQIKNISINAEPLGINWMMTIEKRD